MSSTTITHKKEQQKEHKKEQHKVIIKFIKVIRESFPDAPIAYTFGGCYGLYTILKAVFPGAKAYFTENVDHILTKIDGRFYDVYGWYVDVEGVEKEVGARLNTIQHEKWATVSSGQRFEYMLSKYSDT